MIKGYIFDYGGTLDTAGRHWGKVLWQAYRRFAVPVSELQFREAYVHAERTLGKGGIITPEYTFRMTLDEKLRLELEYLKQADHLNIADSDIKAMHGKMLEELYENVRNETERSRKVLAVLNERYKMALVSNFYGNIRTVLAEFGLDKMFKNVIESAAVGIRKPDPRIFAIGVEALGIKPEETIVVGDSIDKDIIPAKQAGCRTVWLKGEGWSDKQQDESLPDAVITGLSQLLTAPQANDKEL